MAAVRAEKPEETDDPMDEPGETGPLDKRRAPRVQDGPGFFEKMRTLNWDHHIAYISRNEPYRPNTDRNPYLVKVTQAFDEEWIKTTYGSGVYAIRLNVVNPRNSKSQTLDYHKLTIIDKNFPPVLVGYDGWEQDPKNRPWLWAKAAPAALPGSTVSGAGLSADDVLKIVDRVQSRLEPQDRASAGQVMIEAMRTGHAQALEMINEAAQSNSPDKIVGLITALKGLVQSESPRENTGLAVVKEVMGTVKEIVALSRPTQPAEGTTGLAQLKDVIGILREAKDVLGGGEESGGAAEGKWGLYREVATQTGHLVQALTQGFIMWQASRGGSRPAPTPGGASAPSGMLPQLPNPPTPAPIPPVSGAPVDAVASSAGPETVPGSLDPQHVYILNQVGSALVQHVTSDRALPGLDFAQWIEDGYGPMLAPSLAQLGPEALFGILQAYPPLWQQLSPFAPKVQAMLAEFCTWPTRRAAYQAGELPEQQEEGNGESDVPVAAPRPKRRSP
jgi:hypothetical protein